MRTLSRIRFASVLAMALAGCRSEDTSAGSSGGNGASSGGGGASGDTGGGGASAGTSSGGAGGSSSAAGTGGSGGSSEGGSNASAGSGGDGGASSSGGGGGDAGPPPGAKRVFVTSATYSGNLQLQGLGVDGLDGGDNLCQTAAADASLGGTFKAWLSTNSTDAIDRMADVGPWYRLDGSKAFETRASITQDGPLVAIDVDENGDPSAANVWTGTQTTGDSASYRCDEWTSSSPGKEGIIGESSSSSPANWTVATSNPCTYQNALYCFEQ